MNDLIGGDATGEGNVIANNAWDGIAVEASVGNSLLGNTYSNNGGLAIDLANDGVTLNDADDSDTDANNLQNFPVITSAFVSGGNLTVNGTLTSTPNTEFRVELFHVPAGSGDASGHGEAPIYLGSVTVTTKLAKVVLPFSSSAT